MCTAINWKAKEHYFGRNLDLDYSYKETITITPRNFPFLFRKMGQRKTHYAMIGVAYVVGDYPLYYDATNEMGVSMAGLMFSGNAFYPELQENKENISPYEFIPWVLSQCRNMQEVRKLLSRICLVNLPFSKELPLTPMHWMISYKEESLVIESTKEGLKIYENPVGVLTNNPPFEIQLWNLTNYMGLTNEKPENCFVPGIQLDTYSRGMGALGLPGDLSSASRFVRAAFVRGNSVCGETEEENVGQFFHMLTSVEQQKGCVSMGKNKYEITRYSSCCNTDKGIYYYVTYDNRQITAVDMKKENLEGKKLISYFMIPTQQIYYQNI